MGDKRPYKPRKPGAGRKPLKPSYDAAAILQEQMEAAVALYTNNSLQTIATLGVRPHKEKIRTLRVKEIISKLNEILTGYFHYYGITDNSERITAFRYNVMKSLFYWLNRRSQKKSYNWVEFLNMIDNSYPLVRARIYVSVYD